MSKFVSITEREKSRIFSGIDKLVTNTTDGGVATWIPEDEAANYVNKRSLDVTANGTYKAPAGSVFDNVNVNVEKGSGDDSGSDSDTTRIVPNKLITENGEYSAVDDVGGADGEQAGYEQVTVALPMTTKTITENGVYTAADEVDSMGDSIQGYSSIDVQVKGDGIGKQVGKTIKKNGTYLPEDEPEDADGNGVIGFNQVDVALPLMEKKVITHGGVFRPQSEQDENGDEYQGYKSIEVNLKISQPVLDFTMNVDHHKNILTMPFDISIGNTSPADYDEQDLMNPPTVDFSHATIKMYSSGKTLSNAFLGNDGSPFRNNDLNMGAGSIWKKWPDKVGDKEIKNWNDSKAFISDLSIDNDGTLTESGYRIGGLGRYIGSGKNRTEVYGRIYTNHDRFRMKQENNVTKFIFSNSFVYSDNSFVIAANVNNIGWLVENVSFKKDDRFSFTISVKCPSA